MSGIAATPLSPQQADAILQIIKSRLRIIRTAPLRVAAGSPISAKLLPTSNEIEVADLLNGTLDLAAIAKDLIFDKPDPFPVPDPSTLPQSADFAGEEIVKASSATIKGGKPFADPTALLNQPAPIQSNVGGQLGQLFGTVQLPSAKIQLDLKWIIRDSKGKVLQEGGDFIALDGLSSPAVSILAAPFLQREYRLDSLLNPGGSVVCLSLEGTLHLGAASLSFFVGSIPFIQLPLMIPTIVGLFSEANFDVTHDSAALIVVPEHSSFASAEPLMKLLLSMESTLSKLRGIAKLAGFFLGLDEVLGSLPQQPRLRLTAKNQIDHLGNYTIKRKPWWNPLASDKTFDDTVNSLFVFGIPGTEVRFFNDKNCKDATQSSQGGYTVRLNDAISPNGEPPDFFVAIRTLYANNDVAPVTTPEGRISAFDQDTTGDDSWDTDMTSLRFTAPYFAIVRKDKIVQPPPTLVCTIPDFVDDLLPTGRSARKGAGSKRGSSPKRKTAVKGRG